MDELTRRASQQLERIKVVVAQAGLQYFNLTPPPVANQPGVFLVIVPLGGE